MNDKKSGGVFSVLGAATGLANACRFPVRCARFGFCFVPVYAIALFVVGLPLLCAEFYYGQNGNGGKAIVGVMRAARVNSALIGLYYGGNAIKLASAAGGYAVCGSAVSLPHIAVLTAILFVFVFLFAQKLGLASTGKAAVLAYFILFVPLALFGAHKGGLDFGVNALSGGAIWSEGVGQVLVSLSLSCGVMPSFAARYGNGSSPFKLALTVVCVNFFGCVLSAVAVAPYCDVSVDANAITIFSRMVDAAFQSAVCKKLFGCVIFLLLAVVAVNGTVSLVFPVCLALKKMRKSFAVVFAVAVAALTPLFGAKKGQVAECCDVVACCVTAVALSVAESVYFALTDKSRLSLRIASGCVCLPCCSAVLFLSLCSARFTGFPPLAIFCGIAYAAVPPFAVFVVRLSKNIKARKYEKLYQKRKRIYKILKRGIAQRRYP